MLGNWYRRWPDIKNIITSELSQEYVTALSHVLPVHSLYASTDQALILTCHDTCHIQCFDPVNSWPLQSMATASIIIDCALLAHALTMTTHTNCSKGLASHLEHWLLIVQSILLVIQM